MKELEGYHFEEDTLVMKFDTVDSMIQRYILPEKKPWYKRIL